MQNAKITPEQIGNLIQPLVSKLGSDKVFRYRLHSNSFELFRRSENSRRLDISGPPSLVGAELPYDSLCTLIAWDLGQQLTPYPELFNDLTIADLWAEVPEESEPESVNFVIGIHRRVADDIENEHPIIYTHSVEVTHE